LPSSQSGSGPITEQIQFIVADSDAGRRIDQVLADTVTQLSRARLQAWLKDGTITVDGEVVPPRLKVRGGEEVTGQLPQVAESDEVLPEAIALDIHYEDSELIVVNKPAGLVMHIAPGNYTGTLQNGLLHHQPALAAIPRAGIVHRLDKDTSGLVMIAKTLEAHHSLVQQLQERSVHRMYDAVVIGVPVAGSTIDEPIGRHPVDRKKMAVSERGKTAITHYRVAEKYARHCHIRVKLETGRTHQIRVHMAHVRYPLIGDDVYGGRRQIPGGVGDEVKAAVRRFPRQALNASELGITHPKTGESLQWTIDLPDDMQQLINILRADAGHAA
jgi:23S rRNA pseudouridine1911/1915/1917 synthase